MTRESEYKYNFYDGSFIGIFTANIFFEYLSTHEKFEYQLMPSFAACFRFLPRKQSKTAFSEDENLTFKFAGYTGLEIIFC